MSGWICLHRDIQRHWLFNFDEPEKFMAWTDLILSANHQDNKFLLKGQIVECKRGQVAMSQVTLSKRWKWSRPKVQRFLEMLKNDAMIEVKGDHLTSIITICNYSLYQDKSTADVTADVTQTTNKQINKKTSNTGKTKSVFIKPSLEEVFEYFQQRGTHIDPEKFHAYYEARDWRLGKNKMKDWKACLVTWEKNNNSSPAVAQPQPKQVKYWN